MQSNLKSAFCIWNLLRARSSKRAGGLIPRIALDQCRVPERYRTRVPFRAPELEVDQAAQPFHFIIEVLESAGCESVEETGRGLILCPRSSKHRAGAS